MKIPKAYLGDGVYVEWDGFAFVLTADDERFIALEPRELDKFNAYVVNAYAAIAASEAEQEPCES